MKAIIKFFLSEAGRKASLLAGGSGAASQSVEVAREDPSFAAVVEQATVSTSGDVVLDTTTIMSYDRVPGVDELLAARIAYEAKGAAIKAANAEALRQRTLEVLTRRETRVTNDHTVADEVGRGTWRWEQPAWPYGADAGVMASPEAVAWVASLEEAKAKSLEGAKMAAAADRVAKEGAAAAKEAFRESLGLHAGDRAFRIERGALAEVPAWESHARGSNWMAVVQIDPSKPGGLDRAFAAKAKGDYFYLTPRLEVGDAIEFGADYRTGGNKKSSRRWFGYYLRTAEVAGTTYLVLHEEPDGKSAVENGVAHAADQVA